MKYIIAILIFSVLSNNAYAIEPDCANAKGWARPLGYLYFNKSKLLENENFDHTKLSVTRLASERINDNLYHQVHHFAYSKNNGAVVSIIITNDAYTENSDASILRCPVGSVNAYVISKEYVYDH